MKPKKQKAQPLRIFAGVCGIGIISALLLFVNALSGDPFSRAWAQHRALSYAQKRYPEQTFQVVDSYGGTLFSYGVEVQSQESADTHFSVHTRFWLLTQGNESDMVEKRNWTLVRQGREAAQEISALLRKELPELSLFSSYNDGFGSSADCEVDLCYVDAAHTRDVTQYLELFPLDAAFDKAVLQKAPARLCLQIGWDTAPTQEDLQQVLRSLKTTLEKNGYPMAWYDILLVPKQGTHEEVGQNLVESGLLAATSIE